MEFFIFTLDRTDYCLKLTLTPLYKKRIPKISHITITHFSNVDCEAIKGIAVMSKATNFL